MLDLSSLFTLHALRRIVIIFILLNLVNCRTSNEISGRTVDRLSSFTSQVESLVNQSILETKLIQGFPDNSKKALIDPVLNRLLQGFPNVIDLNICFQSGLYYGYINKRYLPNNQTISNVCSTYKHQISESARWSVFRWSRYSDLDAILVYEKPLYKNVNESKVYIGTALVEISYDSLSYFLQATYNTSKHNVIIVDRSTGTLVGTSISTQLTYGNVRNFIFSFVILL